MKLDAESAHKVGLLRNFFFNREDKFAFKAPWGKACPGWLHPEDDWTFEEVLHAHVVGTKGASARIYFNTRDGIDAMELYARIGSYCPAPDGSAAWCCLDFDGGAEHANALTDALGAALYAIKKADALGVPVYLERSGGGNGWHVWAFFEPGTPAWKARALGLLLAPNDVPLAKGGMADSRRGVGIEVFPKSSQVSEGGVGLQVWLPWHWNVRDGANEFYLVRPEDELQQYVPETFKRIAAEVLDQVLTKAELTEEAVFGRVEAQPGAAVFTAAPRRMQGAHQATDGGSYFQRAVARYLAEHPRTYPRSGGECPACGHKGCFGQLQDNPRRWSCFSASHGECDVGLEGEVCWHGDALDLDAAEVGVTRAELLREEGYLDADAAASPLADTCAQGASVALGSSSSLGPSPASNNTGMACASSTLPAKARSKKACKKVYRTKTYATCCDVLRNNAANVLEGKLEFNEMLLTPTIDRKVPPTSIVGILRERIELRLTPKKKKGKKLPKKLTFSEAQVSSALLQVAEERSYHPVHDYLEGIVWDGVERIKDVARELLGITEPDELTQALLKRFFISAVARPLEPGCKVDTVLVLVGAQGARKSSFFKALAGPEWFSDSAVDLKNKDSLMLMRRIWFHEWAELETMRKSEATQVKAHLSSAVDMLRPAYGRRIEEFPRTSIIVASTNIPAFLNDETGSRRFWIIPGCTNIDVKKTQLWRDQLWAEAVALFRAREQWWLTPEEEALRKVRNAEHEQQDIWTDTVLDAVVQRLANNPSVPITTQSLLEENLGKEARDWTQYDQKRVAGILQGAGFNEKRRTVDGKRLTTWMPPPEFLARAEERRKEQAAAQRAAEEERQRMLEAARTSPDKDHFELG